VVQGHRFGAQDLILTCTNSSVFGANKRIKHSGVMKVGQSALPTGVTYGTVRVNG
jgi:hypothetical protein